jgi:hypothetical protein
MSFKFEMEYNSAKEPLIMPEYGRNVQELIRAAKQIEDKEERQAFAEKIIGLMMQMVPQNRNIEDVREKLWKHLFRIAEYDIDVIPLDGQIPTPEPDAKKPSHPGYPVTEQRFRHYGHNVQELIRKAIAMEDGDTKEAFVEVIGNYMKMAFKTWNREHYVSDEIIIEDIKSLSNGKLELHENAELDSLTHSNRRKNKGRDDRGRNDNKGSNRGRRNPGRYRRKK